MELYVWFACGVFCSIIFLIILYKIIKTAVSNGIDDSRSVKELRIENKELERQIQELKLLNTQEKYVFNKRV